MQNQPINNTPTPNPQQLSPRPKKKLTLNTILFAAMISFGVIILGCVIAWIVLLGKVSSDNGKTQLAAYNVLEPESAQPVSQTITSELGVAISYNETELAGYGFSGAITYSGGDLDDARPYSVIRIRPIETSEVTRNAINIDSPELRITTSLQKNFWDILKRNKDYKDLSDIDALVKQTISERSDERNTTVSDATNKTIGDVQYKKITFTHKDENYAVPTQRREDCYLTVQNERPFVVCINNIRPSNFAVVPQLESVIKNIHYETANESVLTEDESKTKDSKMFDSKKDEKITQAPQTDTTEDDQKSEDNGAEDAKIPSYLQSSRDFAAIAKAEPATVRVGVIYCADITLTLPNSKTGTHLTDACVDKSSTGFFVSSEGLIATVGSGVKVTPKEALTKYITGAADSSQVFDRLARVLDYLVKSRIIMETDAAALTAGLQERDRDIIDKINSLSSLVSPEDITIEREEYKYAVQLSDKPIVVNRTDVNSLEFAYSDTIYEADLVSADYPGEKSPLQIYNGESEVKDAAILKLKKESSYPTLSLAASSNVESDSLVTLVGMPMYSFGSLQSGQFRATPLIRQGKVEQTFNGSGNQRLVSISTPSHAGLAGSPALNPSGEVVGVGTYDQVGCPDRKCFASMVIRDTAAISAIAKKRNITLQPINDVTDTWERAIDQYVKGNYSTALELFNKSARIYPANYLAPQFAALTKSQLGSTTDTSAANTAVGILKIVILFSAILLILLIIARLFMKIFSKPHYETQYGQMAGGQYIDSSQWKQGGGYSQGQTPPPVTQEPVYQGGGQPQNIPQPQQQSSPVAPPPTTPQPPVYQPQQAPQQPGSTVIAQQQQTSPAPQPATVETAPPVVYPSPPDNQNPPQQQ